MSAEFSFKNRGLRLTQYSSDHTGVALHTQGSGKVEVVASHHPQSAEGAEQPCHEFYTVDFTHRQEVSKESGDFSHTTRTNDSVTVFVNREEIEALHFALGEVLAQSEGLERGAASVRVTGEVE